jgi:hypothetical protein
MSSTPQTYLNTPFHSVEQVESALGKFETWCIKNNDLRGVFATAYLQITKAIAKELPRGSFNDNDWSARYLVRFANLYRKALIDVENGTIEAAPKSWQMAFNLAKKRDGFIIQHLLLGINAHINHDLAIALYDVNIDPKRNEKLQDHNRINHILEKATTSLKQSVAEKYAPVLKRVDRGLGNLDDKSIAFSIPKAREHAWAMAVALSSAQSDIEKQILRETLDEQAAVLAQLILSTPTRNPHVISGVNTLKWIDRLITKIKSWFR